MRKMTALLMGVLILNLNARAQVTVTNSNTLQVGSASNYLRSGTTGSLGDAQGVSFTGSTVPGTIIEQGYEDEGGGIYVDDDKVIIWSPGDYNLVNFCDEDNFSGQTSYLSAIISYIDGDGNYYQSSDSTAKENITNITSPLNRINQIRGVEYNFRLTANEKDKKSISISGKEKKSGFLAQDLEKVIPEAVTTNESGRKYVNYQAIIPFLVEAVKEQQIQIQNQTKLIKELQLKIENKKSSI
jgi:hypothetical protein